jgi:hypothetical protein
MGLTPHLALTLANAAGISEQAVFKILAARKRT